MTTRPPALWEDDDSTRWVRKTIPWSIGLHVFLIGFGAVWQWIHLPAALPPPSYEVTLMPAPIKKGIPGGAVQPVVNVKAPDEVKAPDMSVEPNLDKARSDALARLEALKRAQALAHPTQVASAATPEPIASPAPKGAPPGAGNGTGDGGSEYGVWGGIPGSATYEQQLQAIVVQNWLPPTWISTSEKPLQCVIRVVIGFDGKITSKSVEASSGDGQFDTSAMRAIDKSDPLPPPPMETKQYLAHKGIPLRFDSRTKLAAGEGHP